MSNNVLERRKQTGRRAVEERFGWAVPGERGKSMDIAVVDLNIDHTYQRDRVSPTKVMRYARNWNWPACGVILVARRTDGTFWAYDGQHRILAARKREDIDTLPCMVFNVSNLKDEAKAFSDTNVARSNVSSIERFKARVVALESNALRVMAAITAIGYTPGKGQTKQIACTDVLERAFKRSAVDAEIALMMCSEIYDGKMINARVYGALAYLECFLQRQDRTLSIGRKDIHDKLLSVDSGQLLIIINKAKEYHNRSGDKYYAAGIVQFINKSKRGRKIPSPTDVPDSPGLDGTMEVEG